jgi:hypothetical protein
MLARVVSFEGVSQERIDQLTQEMNSGEQPADIPATEMLLLHDPDSQKSMAILFFENEDDYARGHATLDAMPSDNTPGSRTGVGKYNVATRMTSTRA